MARTSKKVRVDWVRLVAGIVSDVAMVLALSVEQKTEAVLEATELFVPAPPRADALSKTASKLLLYPLTLGGADNCGFGVTPERYEVSKGGGGWQGG